MKTQTGAILFLLKYLSEHTDKDHHATSSHLREILREHGFPHDTRTLSTYIRTMRETGYAIGTKTREGIATEYWWDDTSWSESEARILIDAVSSAPCITMKKSRELIRKLSTLAGHQYESNLTPQVYVSETLKADNDNLCTVLQQIARAIKKKKQIAFRYFDYNPQKKRVARHDGETYILSPYSTVWQDGRYYVVGWSEKRQDLVSFRLDRMDIPDILPEKIHPRPKDYRVQDYADRVTRMYSGPRETITLRCRPGAMNALIDKFGKGVKITRTEDTFFEAEAEAAVTGTLMAWLFQFAGEIVLTGPDSAVEFYRTMLHQARSDLADGELANLHEMVWKL